jgi:hypothetical protein
MAGAISTLRFSIQLETTFAADSSIGVETSPGSSAACAGRGTEMARLTSGARTNTSATGAESAIAAATAPIDAAIAR